MALRDKFLADMPQEDMMDAPAPANAEAELDAKMADADGAFDELMEGVSPEGDFSASAINLLIDKVNNALDLFGEMAEKIESVEEGEGFPVQLTKAIKMLQQAGIDSGVMEEGLDFDALATDADIKILAGKVDALAKNNNLKTFLRSAGDNSAALLINVETPMAGSAEPAGEEEMDEDEMSKLFTRRMS